MNRQSPGNIREFIMPINYPCVTRDAGHSVITVIRERDHFDSTSARRDAGHYGEK
jgi:hypothetical protein